MSDLIVKVCGITRPDDALAAQDAGADWIGFVFAKSPRRVDVSIAREIGSRVACAKVGVFVDEDVETVRGIAEQCRLDFVQLHGREDQSVCDGVGLPVIKAIRVRTAADLEQAEKYRVHMLLLDAYSPDAKGGTGNTLDWRLLENFKKPYILAGGLNPDNVSAAIKTVRPQGVDASSSLESAPGIKDHSKMTAFIRNAKGAAHAAR